METEPIQVAVVDDHTLFRNGVAALLNELDDIKVIFEAGNGLQMQQQIANGLLPQVILMDINMPVKNGYESARWVAENHPQIKVLALSMFEDDEAVIQMIRNGAKGYLLKESKPRELQEAIRTVHQKGIYLNEMVSGKLLRSVHQEGFAPALTEREIDFLKLCCSELTYKEIADKMFVSPRTVDNYRDALFQKLNIKSRTGLVLYAIQNNIFKIGKM
ncbi:response regulator transcription factor [Mucilaginibacter sp. RS28]|uniref:Response regulator transcription factor n=1 Tax=Mucilaginibacter straminoryzae TaxID=2932774 RepID=A0A9X1X3H8_9SPHI|nr:response regulator transcription factor [Mucilaginibacter straminoryzae]MCJ8210444.1 response regulator transcription factor [Mucilaginibacter straminoryzae]